jgi:hypothetical protein
LSLAAAFGSAVATPASALVITSEVGVNVVAEFDNLGHVLHEGHADTTSGGPANARIRLGNGKNAFNQDAFAQAFSAFRGTRANYWVDLNADNTRSPGDGGIGAAGVDLTYTATKEHGDKSFTLHVTGGKLQLIDPDAGSDPLSAFVDLEAFVRHGTDTLSHTLERASLSGNGGTRLLETFKLTSEGFDIRSGDFTLQDDGTFKTGPGKNIVGATLDLRALNIPVDLSRIVDGTPITIEVTLNAEVRAPGGETGALATLRDPAHAADPDPFAGSPTITFDTASTGPVSSLPEPATLAMLGPALLALVGLGRRRRSGREARPSLPRSPTCRGLPKRIF